MSHVHNMVLAVKGLGKLPWTVIRAFVGCAEKSSQYTIHDMNVTLCIWTFKFRKVVQQQNSGAVKDFILPYSAVYLQIKRWKNYWNRSTFAKVIVKIKVAPFLWPTVYIGLPIVYGYMGLDAWTLERRCVRLMPSWHTSYSAPDIVT